MLLLHDNSTIFPDKLLSFICLNTLKEDTAAKKIQKLLKIHDTVLAYKKKSKYKKNRKLFVYFFGKNNTGLSLVPCHPHSPFYTLRIAYQ